MVKHKTIKQCAFGLEFFRHSPSSLKNTKNATPIQEKKQEKPLPQCNFVTRPIPPIRDIGQKSLLAVYDPPLDIPYLIGYISR
jgi:hypothetical protein